MEEWANSGRVVSRKREPARPRAIPRNTRRPRGITRLLAQHGRLERERHATLASECERLSRVLRHAASDRKRAVAQALRRSPPRPIPPP